MPYAILSIFLAPVLLFALIAYDHGREENLHNDNNEKENNPDERNQKENRTKSDKSSSKNK